MVHSDAIGIVAILSLYYRSLEKSYPRRRFLASGNLSGPSLSKNVIIPLWYVSKYSSQCIFLISKGNSVWSSLLKLFHKPCTFLLQNIHSLVEKYSNMSVNLPIFLYCSTNLKSYTLIILYYHLCQIFPVRFNSDIILLQVGAHVLLATFTEGKNQTNLSLFPVQMNTKSNKNAGR